MTSVRPSVSGLGGSLPSATIPLLVGAIVFIAHIPFVFQGYGADPDAWRVVRAARNLVETGIYIPSRYPGYPLPEYAGALLVSVGLGGPIAFGLLTSFMSALGTVTTFVFARPLGDVRAALVALMVAFTPAVFVGAMGAMDYPWGFAFFMAAAAACRLRAFVWCGVFLGLAIASRPTYGLVCIPLAIMALDYRLSLSSLRMGLPRLLRIAGPAFLIAVGFHAPTLIGQRDKLGIIPRDPELLIIGYNATVGLFGLLGAAVIVFAAIWIVQKVVQKRFHLTPAVSDIVIFSAVTAALYGLLFLRLPDEAAYLTPAIVAPYLLIAASLPLWFSLTTLAALLLSCVLFSIDRQNAGPNRGTVSLMTEGPVFKALRTQAQTDCIARITQELVDREPGPVAVIAGDFEPQIRARVRSDNSDVIVDHVGIGPDGASLVTGPSVDVPDDATFYVTDRAFELNSEEMRDPGKPVTILETFARCP